MYNYPVAECRLQEIKYGRHVVKDAYEWMRDAAAQDTVSFTNEQNVFTDQYFMNYQSCLEKYLDEQRAMNRNLMYREIVRTAGEITALGVYNDGISQSVRLNEDFSVREVITDSDFMEGVHVYGISPNPVYKNLLVLHVLRDKAERMSGLVYDTDSKKVLAELKDTFSVSWSSCGAYVYYSKAEHRRDGTIENTLRRYCVGADEEAVLYTHQGHAAYGSVYPLDEGGVIAEFAVDYHAGDLVICEDGQQMIEVPYDGNDRTYIGTSGGRHFFLTDEEAALGKIVTIERGQGFHTKQTYIDETDEKISQAGINQGKIICIYENAGSQSICVYDEERRRRDIRLPCVYGKIGIAEREFASDKPLFSYESFSVPASVMELNLENYTAGTVYESGPACEDVTEELTYYMSSDGTRLPAYIIRKNDVKKDGDNQTLFYGYGGYNAANYVSARVCGMTVANWIEAGGIYVHCIIRGGGEFGEDWHRGGWKENKKNVFDDFCSIVEGVIRDGWTRPEKIAICGLSNGGLLMTALITRRPDLFGCVIASVPQTDLLGFVYDDRGPMYITEYGDPRTDDMFEYMKSYSPYHNIREDASYPGIYIQAGAMDNNVPAYHAKKFAARMQSLQGKRPVLLRVLPYGSHDQGMGEYFHRTIAEIRTFIDIELALYPDGSSISDCTKQQGAGDEGNE